MRARVPSIALLVVVLIFLPGILVGCGGGGDQSGNGGEAQKGGEKQGGGADQGGGATDENAPQVKIALGSIKSVEPDKRKIALKPSSDIQGGEKMKFKVRKNADIEVNDQQAEMADLKAGQQAQIEYVSKNDRNRARAVKIVGGGG